MLRIHSFIIRSDRHFYVVYLYPNIETYWSGRRRHSWTCTATFLIFLRPPYPPPSVLFHCILVKNKIWTPFIWKYDDWSSVKYYCDTDCYGSRGLIFTSSESYVIFDIKSVFNIIWGSCSSISPTKNGSHLDRSSLLEVPCGIETFLLVQNECSLKQNKSGTNRASKNTPPLGDWGLP
jgi:hypothetical protein